MRMCPCQDCNDRALDCHSNCHKYIEYLLIVNRAKKQKQKNMQIIGYAHDEHVKARRTLMNKRK